MFLSKVTLNPRHRGTWHLLNQPYEIHRTISRAFSEDKAEYQAARPLYRVDISKDGPPLLLVQSRLPADWSRCEFADNQLLGAPQCQKVEFSFAAGRALRFRLRANPCQTVKGEKRGERVPLWEKKPDGETPEERDKRLARIEAQWEAWLYRKAGASGFEVLSLLVTPEGSLRMGRAAPHIAFNAVLFEGVLRVIAPPIFLAALDAGIGPGKGFGFGLLSLARA